MRLIIFDIDGTLIHAHPLEIDCYEKALSQIAGISHISKDIHSYPHVTDSGIAVECFKRHLGRFPTPTEMENFEDCFISLFKQKVQQYPLNTITGANSLLMQLHEHKQVAMAIATGCFYHSAKLKLEATQLWMDIPLATANDHFNRVDIMKMALAKSKIAYECEEFDSVTYIGDGPWDIRASQMLNWDLIAIAGSYTEKELRKWGADKIFPDLTYFFPSLNA